MKPENVSSLALMNVSQAAPSERSANQARLQDAVMQAEMLCSIEGEQSEVCELAKAYVVTLRHEISPEPTPTQGTE